MINLSIALLVLMILLFVAVLLIDDKRYQRIYAWNENIKNWLILADLQALIAHLDRLCPPIGLIDNKPTFRQFVKNPEYHLYRALVRILDGQTLLADFLQRQGSVSGASQLRAEQLDDARKVSESLQALHPNDNFWQMIRDYQYASQGLSKTERAIKVSS